MHSLTQSLRLIIPVKCIAALQFLCIVYFLVIMYNYVFFRTEKQYSLLPISISAFFSHSIDRQYAIGTTVSSCQFAHRRRSCTSTTIHAVTEIAVNDNDNRTSAIV